MEWAPGKYWLLVLLLLLPALGPLSPHAGSGYAVYSNTGMFPPASAHPAPGAEISTHAAISSGTHESFHVQFPHQVHRHVSKAIIPLPNGLCSGIVSRTFLYALGIPDSLKLPFLVTTAHRAISKTLAAPSPGLPLSHNGREQQGLVSLENNGRFPGFLWRSTLVADSRVGCRCRANVKEQTDLSPTCILLTGRGTQAR